MGSFLFFCYFTHRALTKEQIYRLYQLKATMVEQQPIALGSEIYFRARNDTAHLNFDCIIISLHHVRVL